MIMGGLGWAVHDDRCRRLGDRAAGVDGNGAADGDRGVQGWACGRGCQGCFDSLLQHDDGDDDEPILVVTTPVLHACISATAHVCGSKINNG